MPLKSYYNKAIDGSEVKLIELYQSLGETCVIYEDEDGDTFDITLEEFEELVGEEIPSS